MVAIQHHRGPDDHGMYVDAAHDAGLGHNRLSILDLSKAGHQPMCSADGTRWITFNGEIYNYRELRAALSDYPFKSQTDTEVILGAFERWGEACVTHFIGMFAFAIWDDRSKTLFLRARSPWHQAVSLRLAERLFFVCLRDKSHHCSGISGRIVLVLAILPAAWYLRSQ